MKRFKTIKIDQQDIASIDSFAADAPNVFSCHGLRVGLVSDKTIFEGNRTEMFAPERINVIKTYIREHKQAEVHTVAAMLNVSEVTVRRDFEKLEEEGFLTRIHGGAVLGDQEPEAAGGTGNANAEKEPPSWDEIARIALLMVKDGDIVGILGGDVNRLIATRLEERSGLTVLTNDLLIAMRVAGQAGNEVVLLGGSLHIDDHALYGSLALGNIGKFFVNRLFIEVDGINDRLQLTVSHQEKAALIQEAITVSEEQIIVCPSERFGKNAFFRLGQLNPSAKVITDSSLPVFYKESIFARNSALYTSINAFEGTKT